MKEFSIKFTGKKSTATKKLIISMLDIIKQCGLNIEGVTDRRKERMAEACLAVAGISGSFKEARSACDNRFSKTRDIIAFINSHFSENISPGSYDDIRRKDLLLLIDERLIINSSEVKGMATNNPTRGYALSPEFARLIKSYKTDEWDGALKCFFKEHNKAKAELEEKKHKNLVKVELPSGKILSLSQGLHNELQKLVVESFLPVFGFDADVLYIGDTSDKFLFKDENSLKTIGFFELSHNELPDIVAYSKGKNLLFLIEAVHSSGPMSEIRVRKLKKQLTRCKANIVFVTAFMSKTEFKRWVMDIAWETEVWVAEDAGHLIHFNGYKFLEIHK